MTGAQYIKGMRALDVPVWNLMIDYQDAEGKDGNISLMCVGQDSKETVARLQEQFRVEGKHIVSIFHFEVDMLPDDLYEAVQKDPAGMYEHCYQMYTAPDWKKQMWSTPRHQSRERQ